MGSPVDYAILIWISLFGIEDGRLNIPVFTISWGVPRFVVGSEVKVTRGFLGRF